jgi:Autotransporter beta-domain.
MRRIFAAAVGAVGGWVCLAAPAAAYDHSCHYDSFYGSYVYCDENTVEKSSASEVQSNATRAAVSATAGAVANRVAQSLKVGGRQTAALGGAGQTGVSAGDGALRYSAWAAIGGNTLSSSVSGGDFDGTLATQTLGFDVVLNERTVVGLSAFHEGNDFDTDFNGGDLSGSTWSLVPYAGHDFGQGTSIDGMVGLSYVTGTASRAGKAAKGDIDGYRVMAALNGHHSLALGGPWLLRGDLGGIWAYSRNQAYTETGPAALRQSASTTHLVQGRAGGRLSYLWGQVEPFAAAYYAYDFVADRAGDDGIAPGGSGDSDEFQFYAGLDWYPTDTESVGVEVSRVVGRDRTESMGLLLNARLRF